MRSRVTRLGLALVIVVAGVLAPVSRNAVVEARQVGPVSRTAALETRILGRHTFLGVVFRMTPLGRAWATVEDRQDAYRSANNWLAQAQTDNDSRQIDLRRARAVGQLDLRSYVHSQATLMRHAKQYVEVTERMKKIGHDNFNRGFAQQIMEIAMPRVVGAELFTKTVGELQNTLQVGQAALEGGVKGIQALANKAYPDFMREGRADVQKAIQRLDETGLSGGPVAEIRSRLQMLDSRLGELEGQIPEAVKPDEVKQLQEEANQAVNGLKAAQEVLSKGVARLRDKSTVYFPQRSVLKDTVVKEKMAEFSADLSAVGRAREETRLRRALGPRLDEALARAGVDPSDPLYTRIRQRALSKFDPARDDVSDADLTGMCVAAAKEIRAEAQQPRVYGIARLEGDQTNLHAMYESEGVGSLGWRTFQDDVGSQSMAGCWDFAPNLRVDNATLSLTINLDTGEMSGSWEGTACCPRGGYEGLTGKGYFEGAFYGAGLVQVDQDGKGFSFEGNGYTMLSISGYANCGEEKQGTRDDTVPTEVLGEWRAGKGKLSIGGHDSGNSVYIALVVADPPFVLSPQ